MTPIQSSRRTFLKLAGGATVSASVGAHTQSSPAQNTHDPAASASSPMDALSCVNVLQGTDSTPLFSRGNTLPIVALPFAMAHWVPQTSTQPGWFFQPHDCRTQGIRCTHQLSPWLGDYGYATFMPFQGEALPKPEARASSYRPSELSLSPHALRMRLTRYRCWLELVPTDHGAIVRVEFEDPGEVGLYIDLPGEDSEVEADLASGTLRALTHDNRGGVQSNFAAYYAASFDRPLASCEIKALEERRVAVVRFQASSSSILNIRIATSFISHEQARHNLDLELGGSSFDALKIKAAQRWDEALGRVRIEGASESQRRTFYSCLYRTQLFPRIWHEQDPSGKTVHRSPYTGNVEPGVMYADHGYWDDYHAWYPMMALLYPERLSEICQGWVNAYKEGGWFPQFPCPGYRGGMTGSLIDSVFAEAVAKSIPGFDVQLAYEGLKKHATQKGDPDKGYGRVGIEDYLRLGYVPADRFTGAVAQSLEFAYGDFCISQVASAAGAPEDAAMFRKRSANWKNLFDKDRKFMRGKLASGQWLEPFDEFTWGGAYVEGGAWQYRFNVLHDPEGLMEAYGGREAFIVCLEQMLTQPPRFHVGTYGAEIHEMSEMAAVDFGQYAHSNQPVHNFLYMFTAAGRRDRAQYWVHRVLNELYSPDNFAGDEDTGATAAWYILSSLGLFALCPGKPEWSLGAPLFPSANVTYPGGRTLRIEAHSDKPGAFLSHVTLNGKVQNGHTIPHAELLSNATLVFSTA
jgi:predicted alpha-1,2-mannosidase